MASLVQLQRRPGDSPASSRPAKVLLVSPRYSSSYFPIGLAYVSSYIRQCGHEVVACNLNHHDHDAGRAELARLLREHAFDAIGITGLTVAFNAIESLIEFLRPRCAAPIVLGGGITSCESELVMRTLRPDYMVVSEGELIFRDLLAVITAAGDPASVAGIWYWDGETPRATGDGPSIANLDELPFPDLELFGIAREMELQSTMQVTYHETRFHAGKTVPITASRSCPFRCTFCYHAGMGKYRRHSMENVVDHIESILARTDATHISIYDELFSANKKRIVEFCDLLEQRGIQVSWFCQLRVDQLDQDLLHRMRRAGCRHISFGFESGSDTVLDSMDKKITAAQIARAVELTRNAKIGIQANFLFGDPAETEQTLQESLAFQREHDLMFVDWSAVIPYPGTRLYARALERGLIGDRVEFIRSMCDISSYLWRGQVNLTELSDERFLEHYVALRELNDRNHRTRPAIVRHGRATGPQHSCITVECPSCNHAETLELPYPPGPGDTPISTRAIVGVQGYNIVCDACNRKMHLAARRIPHVASFYADFQAALDRCKAASTPVVIVPAMDRYFGVFAQDVDLEGLDVVAALDWRAHRAGAAFMGVTVESLDHAHVQRHRDATFVVLPWVESDDAVALLRAAGVQDDAILCWTDRFATHTRPQPRLLARASGARAASGC
ncbi:MAG: cobalamin-dependent protein [Deltaproteobacteria bacterium]|nr:cobalamin-dependent protein [Deltaproteobacteria bacterium]MBK8716498.1 cobalamin-dependent protein [Deltaproteobacteria bacterium]MBP7287312.1 cobalamin-dependent protein [Nannocystaceae bacterium]